MGIVDGSCIRNQEGDQREECLCVEQPIPEGKDSKWEMVEERAMLS